MNKIRRFILLTLGSILFAIGFSLFIEPAHLAPGGITGIIAILSRIYPTIDTGALFLILNIPILILGAITFGLYFLLGTIYATALSSVTMSLINSLFPAPISNDVLCLSVAGAIFTGVGLGLVFRVDATTGGTDIIARLIHKRFSKIRLSIIFFTLDAVVILLSGVIFREFDIIVYSALTAGLTSYVFNKILYFKKQ